MAKLRELTCGCGRTFRTDAPNRRRCYTCSPSRMPQGFDPTGGNLPDRSAPALSVVRPVDSIDSAGTVLPTLTQAGDGREPDVPREPGEMETFIREALVALSAERSWRGGLAIALAKDVDSSATTGSQRSTLSAQIEKIMNKIESLAPVPPDELDDVRAEIERKRAEAQ